MRRVINTLIYGASFVSKYFRNIHQFEEIMKYIYFLKTFFLYVIRNEDWRAYLSRVLTDFFITLSALAVSFGPWFWINLYASRLIFYSSRNYHSKFIFYLILLRLNLIWFVVIWGVSRFLFSVIYSNKLHFCFIVYNIIILFSCFYIPFNW